MLLSILIIVLTIAIVLLITRHLIRRAKRKNTIGIFHLYCSSGGGGERVLWHSVKILIEKYPKYTIYIYTHKDVHDDALQILFKVRDLFKIDLISDQQAIERLEFVPLSLSSIVESKRYPFLTLFFQNFMSILLALQASYHLVPEIYIESIGFTFTLPVFKLFGSTVITYVHYPTISSDMIHNVRTSTHASFNNREIFTQSSTLRKVKLLYYQALALSYGFAGRCADLVLVNSSWTQNHIKSLWKTKVNVVFPPCDVESFKSLPLDRFPMSHKLNIISVAQFRPEKDHQLQIEALDSYLSRSDLYDAQLTLYGGCRDAEDQKRVDYLSDMIGRLELSSRVEIVVNACFDKLREGFRDADVAIHTMKNEHFGIVLLEFMAAGLITIAHRSGGPKTDIIEEGKDGFLADDVQSFADKLSIITSMDRDSRQKMRANARRKADQFSVRVFEDTLIKLVDHFFTNR